MHSLYIKTTNNVNFGTRTYDDLGRRTRGRPKTLCWSQERTMNLKFWSYKCHNFILIQVRMEEAPDFLFFQEKLSTAIVQNIVLAMMKNLYDPTIIYLFNVINRNTRKRYEICRKIRLKKPERRQWLSMEANFSKVSDLKMHSDVAEIKLHWFVKMIISSWILTYLPFGYLSRKSINLTGRSKLWGECKISKGNTCSKLTKYTLTRTANVFRITN